MERRLNSLQRTHEVAGIPAPLWWAAMVMVVTFHQLHEVGALRVGYYAQSCPNAEGIIRSAMERAMQQDSGTAPGILRLHFHDCFVDGCDGSVLLDGPNSEKTSPPNFSLRGFEAVDAVKNDLEAACPGVVSCADILAYGARDAVVMTGGLGWAVQAGRLDSRVSIAANAAANIPDPSLKAPQLTAVFARKGLSQSDMIVLSGAHTIGRAHCASVKSRLYPVQDPQLTASLASQLRSGCPPQGGTATFSLDATPGRFDNVYYANVVSGRGIMNSDQALFEDAATRGETVFNSVGAAPWAFRFTQVMVKMGNVGVKTAPDGEVRRSCRFTN